MPSRQWDPRWDTVGTRARVLGVARTLTSATRLMDVLPLLRARDGIKVFLTVNPGSAFTAGLSELLPGLGPAVLSWSEACAQSFDLVVSTAAHASLRHLRKAPLMVLPHGAGYNRLVSESTGDSTSPVGLSARELMYEGEVIPTRIGLSHVGQFEQLRLSCPQAVDRAVVIGDPCFDRILASLERRERYRSLLGVTGGRRLVLVNSTWSRHSLLAHHPDLPERLAAELPVDEFAVAVVLHPNIWARHTPFHVRGLLDRALAAGVLLIPPQEGWQAALIASDCIVGDHSSVSFYGAALDRATLLAGTGSDELDHRSPTAAFTRHAPKLDPSKPLHPQVADALRTHRAGALLGITDRSLGRLGESAGLVQEVLYGLLGLPAPGEPPTVAPVPDPRPVADDGPQTFDVEGWIEEPGAVRLCRRPVVRGADRPSGGFYAVTSDETDQRRPQSAEVMARHDARREPSPVVWAETVAARFPGLNVAVATLDDERRLVRLRDGGLLEAVPVRPWGHTRLALDPVLLGSAVNIWLTEGGTAAELSEGLRIRTGTTEVTVAFAVRGDAPSAQRLRQ